MAAEEAIKAYHGHVLSAVARAHGKVNSALPTASAVGVVVAIGAGDDGSFVVVDAKFAQELHPGASMVRFSKAELDGMKKANDVMIDGCKARCKEAGNNSKHSNSQPNCARLSHLATASSILFPNIEQDRRSVA